MPTGYTHGVQSGEIKDFSEFALQCARAFGANIMMRDDPADKPIKEYVPSDFYRLYLQEAESDLERVKAMSEEECRAEANKDRTEALESHEKRTAEANEQRARYQAMLNKAEEWEPPTTDHVNFKEFMIQQLGDSILHDCDISYYGATELTGKQWKEQRIEELERDILRYKNYHQEEIERTQSRNDWNRDLITSLVTTSAH